MAKLIWTKGLSGSGKSTEAHKYQAEDSSIVLVSKDDLRRMMHGDKWSGSNEKMVVAIEDIIIRDTLRRGRSVIVHDTNLHPKHEKRFKDIAKEFSVQCECIDLTDADIEECIRRDLKREYSVGERVIRGQYAQFLAPKPSLKIDNPKGLPLAIICDLDGTLAHSTNRSYYGETEKYLDDAINEPLAQILRAIADTVFEQVSIVFASGREEEGRKWTEEWLAKNNMIYDALYMRATGDQRSDWVVKNEILKFIQTKYCVIAAIDDRLQVVRNTWVKNGIFCMNVNQYEVDF